MIIRMTSDDLIQMFKDYGRTNFSYAAIRELFDWYEEIDPDWEVDVIAICCDWAEYTEDELIKEFGEEAELYGEDATIDNLLDYLRDETSVLEANGNYLVNAF